MGFGVPLDESAPVFRDCTLNHQTAQIVEVAPAQSDGLAGP
jgi:hypothetical protein